MKTSKIKIKECQKAERKKHTCRRKCKKEESKNAKEGKIKEIHVKENEEKNPI
jgi:hypothetical protein